MRPGHEEFRPHNHRASMSAVDFVLGIGASVMLITFLGSLFGFFFGGVWMGYNLVVGLF